MKDEEWISLQDFAKRTSSSLKTLRNKVAAHASTASNGVVWAEFDGIVCRKFMSRWRANFSTWLPAELKLTSRPGETDDRSKEQSP